MYKALIFDLDGVIVDTAKYHYIAWKQLADSLGIPFDERDNDRLKGVSRMRSLEIILEIGSRAMSDAEKESCCARKNEIYTDFISRMREDEILPGVKDFLAGARRLKYLTALGSASKNTAQVLDRLKLWDFFDVVIDGTKVSRPKPDPEVFLKCAEELKVLPGCCIVFEDADAGIEAAHAAGMKTVGIAGGASYSGAGTTEGGALPYSGAGISHGSGRGILSSADLRLAGFTGTDISQVLKELGD